MYPYGQIIPKSRPAGKPASGILQGMPLTTIYFDLDDTLYPPDSGVWEAVGDRILEFMHNEVGIPLENIVETRMELFNKYGTTLRGLNINYGIDIHKYLAYVHDIPLAQFIQPNPALREILQTIPANKFIFTNADKAHARRTLAVLGIEDCFDGMVDVLDVQPYCKPDPEAFATALKIAGETDYQQCILVDDHEQNLQVARQLGMYTIKPHSCSRSTAANACIPSINDLPRILDPLLKQDRKNGNYS